MMGPDEYDADLALESLTERISEQAVDHFTRELSWGALHNVSPSVLRVRTVLDEAQRVRAVSPSACVVFGATAVEIVLKKLMLEPLIVGLIHNADAAPLVTAAIFGNHALSRARELVVQLVKVAAEIDLDRHVRDGATLPFLSETKALASQRDTIVHRGEKATDKNALHALELADEMLHGVFAKLLWTFNLRMVQPGEHMGLLPREKIIINSAGKISGVSFVRAKASLGDRP